MQFYATVHMYFCGWVPALTLKIYLEVKVEVASTELTEQCTVTSRAHWAITFHSNEGPKLEMIVHYPNL